MRHAIAVVLLVGCGDSGSSSSIEISPGPVATVTEGNMLQLAARVPGDPRTFELLIDEPVAALFDVHDLANTEGGAILTLVPRCGALGTAPNGSVSMSLSASGADIAPVPLSIEILSEADGVCAGAPEHSITHAALQVADIPDTGRVLCTKTTAQQPSANDPEREVLRSSASVTSHLVAKSGGVVCGAETVTVDLWPPSDAPPTESFLVETFSCDTTGCDSPASMCCAKDSDRRIALTSTQLGVPVRSRSELVTNVDGTSMACADLDNNGTPELVLAGALMKFSTQVGLDNRFTQNQSVVHANGLLAFNWKSGAATIEHVMVGGFGVDVLRAQFDNSGAVAWQHDPYLSFATSDVVTDLAQPQAVLPIETTRDAGASYVGRLAGTKVDLTCISPTCTAGMTQIDVNIDPSLVPSGFGVADINGDGSQDLIVTYHPLVMNVGDNSIVFHAFAMAWGTTPTATSMHLAGTTDLALELASLGPRMISVPSEMHCDRIYVLDGQSDVYELNPTTCITPSYAPHLVPAPNLVYAIATTSNRVLISTALGVFELTHGTGNATTIRQVDPLLQEQLATTGNALVDPSASNYGQRFAPCYATTPSVAFQASRTLYEWAEIDTSVEGFGALE